MRSGTSVVSELTGSINGTKTYNILIDNVAVEDAAHYRVSVKDVAGDEADLNKINIVSNGALLNSSQTFLNNGYTPLYARLSVSTITNGCEIQLRLEQADVPFGEQVTEDTMWSIIDTINVSVIPAE